ncbi:hypothetical protein Ctob_016300, partial [Chrysochromulina tobinii]
MSLLLPDTYRRPDAEVLPLITPAAARATTEDGNTPLHVAAYNSSSVAVVQALLAAYPEAAKATDKDGYTPLHWAAACSSSVAVVQALLAAYPEAAMATNTEGWTSLHCAAFHNSSVAVVQALLAAYPEAAMATDVGGDTPAEIAKSNDNAEVKAFFARMSLLMDGSTYERPDAEVLPLITPAAARATDSGGWTSLHCAAAWSSSVAVVQALLAAYPEAAKATTE